MGLCNCTLVRLVRVCVAFSSILELILTSALFPKPVLAFVAVTCTYVLRVSL